MNTVQIPTDLDAALDEAWEAAQGVPGFLMEEEARFLGMMAVCAPRDGVIAVKVINHFGDEVQKVFSV